MPHRLIIGLGGGYDSRRIAELRGSCEPCPNVLARTLNIGSQVRAAAAAILFHCYPESKILFSGGKTERDWPSEAAGMKAFAMTNEAFPVPDDAIEIEEESLDTAENVRKVCTKMREHPKLCPEEDTVLVTSRKQLGRASTYFGAYGMRVRPYAAEDILKTVSQRGMPIAKATTPKQMAVETALRLWQVLDRKGEIISAFIRAKRTRL